MTLTLATSGEGFFAPIVEWLVELMERIGPVGAGVAVFLDNIFPPIPSEVVLPLAGMAASNGAFSVWAALAWATAGSLVSALIWYFLARALGAVRLRRMVDRVPLMSGEDVDRATVWFKKNGRAAVFFGRMVPGVRSLISLPAGFTWMPLVWFGLLTSAGSLIWNSIFIFAGYFLGEAWSAIEPYSRAFELVAFAVILGLIAWFLTVRIRAMLRNKKAPEPGVDEAASAQSNVEDVRGSET